MIETIVSKMFKIDYVNSFQFVVITEAIFGMGMGAAFVLGAPRLFSAANFDKLIFGMTISLAILLTVLLWSFQGRQIGFVGDSLLTLAIFVAFGVVLALLFRFAALNVHKMYFWNLVGSGVGAALVPVGFNAVGLEGTSLLVAAAMAVVAIVSGFALGRVPATMATLVCVAIFGGWPWLSRPVSPGSLSREEYHAKISLTRWNHFARIDVQRSEAPVEWGLSTAYHGPRTMGRYFTFDCVAIREDNLRYSSIITTLDRTDSLKFDITYLPHYGLADGSRILVIGSGGGKDVLAARSSPHAQEVVAVEINPLIFDIMREQFPESYQATYGGGQVKLYVDEIRSFLARDTSRYHLLEIGTLKNQALLSAAATQLEENYIYTTEAFQAFRDHLYDDGILSVTWYSSNTAFFARVLATARSVFGELDDRVLFFESRTERPMATLIVSKRPLSEDRRLAILQKAEELEFTTLYPAMEHGFAKQVIEGGVAATASEISPVTDDRPFFYRFQSGVTGIMRIVVAVGAVAAATILVLLLLQNRWSAQGSVNLAPALPYFLGLGVGYLAMQLFLLQKLTFFIGQPVYSLATVLGGLLVANGLGSLCFPSTRVSVRTGLILLVSACLVYGYGLYPLLNQLVGAPLLLHITFSVALLSPIGFLMGIGFPAGLAELERQPSTIPYGFAVNACGTVFGMSLSVCLAIYAGYTALAGLGALFYALSGVFCPSGSWRNGEGMEATPDT